MTVAARLAAKKRAASIGKPKKALAKDSERGLEALVAELQGFVDTFQYERAAEAGQKVLSLAPEDADLRFLMGSVHLELGSFAVAFEHLQTSLRLCPDTTPDRYFALAQLLQGPDALQAYELGLAQFHKQQGVAVDARKVATACCAAAEIFLTDLCDEADAPDRCEQWLDQAQSLDPVNAEAFRVRADLRVCQERPQEARDAVVRAVHLWNEELAVLLAPKDDLSGLEASVELPSYESRTAALKILIELGSQTDEGQQSISATDLELLQLAVSLAEQLLKEDDSIIMTWYLLALALKLQAQAQISDASQKSALNDALEGGLRAAKREELLTVDESTGSVDTRDDIVAELVRMLAETDLVIDWTIDEDGEEEEDDDVDEDKSESELDNNDDMLDS